MSKNSIADQMVNHENLIVTAKASAAEVPGITAYIAPLEEVLVDLKDLNPRLETRKGVKQQEIQERKALLKKAKDLASRIRAALKAHFGLDNERLVEFGARPVRPRTKSQTKAQKNDKPEPALQTPTPAPTAKP
ncbi:MAG: hypothetical protein QOF89_740 [Acidobacteriota bacterium]|jgi:hypothetical protein|nr:hypothetical protein [Acidobacteriota bacterium]